MTDDIVTRLNYIASRCTHGLHTNAPEGSEVYVEIPCQRCKPLLDAADEIERLQADRDRWRFAAEAVWYATNPILLADARRLYEMAEVRGE